MNYYVIVGQNMRERDAAFVKDSATDRDRPVGEVWCAAGWNRQDRRGYHLWHVQVVALIKTPGNSTKSPYVPLTAEEDEKMKWSVVFVSAVWMILPLVMPAERVAAGRERAAGRP